MSEDWENVILLSADALHADHLSCYGYRRDTSPMLDKLAEEIYERHLDSDEMKFGDNSNRSLCSGFEAHAEQRIRVTNDDNSTKDNNVDEEINRRLSALGYKK